MAASFMNVKILLHLGRDVLEESGCVVNLFSIVLMCVYVMKQLVTGYFVLQWVPDGDTQQRSTVIKIDTPNQFAPQGSNPKEFQQKQKSVSGEFTSINVSYLGYMRLCNITSKHKIV